VERVYTGGVASATTIYARGNESVLSGGLGEGATVYNGGILAINADGVADNTTLSTGGEVLIYSGGVASRTLVDYGGVEIIKSGGFDSGATVYGLLSGPGVETGAIHVAAGGSVVGVTFASGALDYLSTGANQSGVTVSSGGTLELARSIIFSAYQSLLVGPAASNTVVSGATLLSGANLETYGLSIYLHATETVVSGGVAISAIVNAEGTLVVSSGGVISGGILMRGGTAIIAGAVGSGQTVTIQDAGVTTDLELDNLPAFSAKISGLNAADEKIDLGGFAYSSGETRTWTQASGGASGTLTVSDGGQVANLVLIGAYTTSNFTLSDDGHGGTFIIDPPATASPARVASFVQTMAVLGAGSTLSADGSVYASAAATGLMGATPLLPSGVTSAAAHG
jgi:autotransporter passenger strand-loop-strand repeat protein